MWCLDRSIYQGNLEGLQVLVLSTQTGVCDRLLGHWGKLSLLFCKDSSFCLILLCLETFRLSICHHRAARWIRRNQHQSLLECRLCFIIWELIRTWNNVILLNQLADVYKFRIGAGSHVCRHLGTIIGWLSLRRAVLRVHKVLIKSSVIFNLVTDFRFNRVCSSPGAFPLQKFFLVVVDLSLSVDCPCVLLSKCNHLCLLVHALSRAEVLCLSKIACSYLKIYFFLWLWRVRGRGTYIRHMNHACSGRLVQTGIFLVICLIAFVLLQVLIIANHLLSAELSMLGRCEIWAREVCLHFLLRHNSDIIVPAF